MQKYMTHPKLGGKLVYMDDFESMEKEGWVFGEPETITYKPDFVVPVRENITSATIKIKETPEQQYEAKFGKKPHWKMSTENIKKALE